MVDTVCTTWNLTPGIDRCEGLTEADLRKRLAQDEFRASKVPIAPHGAPARSRAMGVAQGSEFKWLGCLIGCPEVTIGNPKIQWYNDYTI
jgi:hypothetical protein